MAYVLWALTSSDTWCCNCLAYRVSVSKESCCCIESNYKAARRKNSHPTTLTMIYWVYLYSWTYLSFSSWNVFKLQYESFFPWAHLIWVWNIDLVDKGQGSISVCVCLCVCVYILERAGARELVCMCTICKDMILSFILFWWSKVIWHIDYPSSLKIPLIIAFEIAFEKQTSLWDWKRPSVFSVTFVHGVCNKGWFMKVCQCEKIIMFVTNSFTHMANQQF